MHHIPIFFIAQISARQALYRLLTVVGNYNHGRATRYSVYNNADSVRGGSTSDFMGQIKPKD